MSEHDTDAVVERINDILAKRQCEHPCPPGFQGCLCLKGTREALSALKPGDRLPGGGVWMPEEATDRIVEAICTALQYDYSQSSVESVYRAMLAAAGDGK